VNFQVRAINGMASSLNGVDIMLAICRNLRGATWLEWME
jgi:hypothetical protein